MPMPLCPLGSPSVGRLQSVVVGREPLRRWEALTVKCKINFESTTHKTQYVLKHWPNVFSLRRPNVHCLTLGQCIFGNGSNVILQTLVQRGLRRHWPNVCKATLGQCIFGNGSNVASQILAQRRLTDVGPTSVRRRWANICDAT